MFRQQLIKLWPINIIWPFMTKLFRCKRPSTSSLTETSTQRNSYFGTDQNLELDLTLVVSRCDESCVS